MGRVLCSYHLLGNGRNIANVRKVPHGYVLAFIRRLVDNLGGATYTEEENGPNVA